MRVHHTQRHGVLFALVVGLSGLVLPSVSGCQNDKTTTATNSNSDAGLRQQLEHKPTASEVQTALSKAPPDIRAMLESQMKAGQARQQPVAPTKAGGGFTNK